MDAEIGRRINEQLAEAPFFVDVDQFLGAFAGIFTVTDILGIPALDPRDPRLLRILPLGKRWESSSEDWEITGQIVVTGAP